MNELDRLLHQEAIKNEQERNQFVSLFKQYYQGRMLVTAYYTIEYKDDKFWFVISEYGDEDGPGFHGKSEITYRLAKQMYKEIK